MRNPSGENLVKVKTTLPVQPYPPIGQRQHFTTERLLIRPLAESDAAAFHEMRLQQEVMQWTGKGKPDANIEESKEELAKRFPPNDVHNYDFAVCLRDSGEMVGMGGSNKYIAEMGWPAVGYIFRKEAWGKGFATEFVKAWLEAWWALPRHEVEIEVDEATVKVDGSGAVVVEERICAVADQRNGGSLNVLKKCGFQPVKTFDEKKQDGTDSTLCGFMLHRPSQATI